MLVNGALPVAGTGGWSTDGCQYDTSATSAHTCRCSHLTNFALLQVGYVSVCRSL